MHSSSHRGEVSGEANHLDKNTKTQKNKNTKWTKTQKEQKTKYKKLKCIPPLTGESFQFGKSSSASFFSFQDFSGFCLHYSSFWHFQIFTDCIAWKLMKYVLAAWNCIFPNFQMAPLLSKKIPFFKTSRWDETWWGGIEAHETSLVLLGWEEVWLLKGP